MTESFDEFKPRNGWAVAAMVIFALAFIGFIVSIFIYETQRDKPKPWWCWIGFIISIVLLVVAFATFSFINLGGTKGYHYMMRTSPDWESRQVVLIDKKDVAAVHTSQVGSYVPVDSRYYRPRTQTVSVRDNNVWQYFNPSATVPGTQYVGPPMVTTTSYTPQFPSYSLSMPTRSLQ